MTKIKSITLIQPDDWHCHLRDTHYLKRTVADSALQFHRALIMPNLKPPIMTVDEALAYKKRIENVIPNNTHFLPLMTLYLHEKLSLDEIIRAKKSNITACKYYPAGATTHSDAGISDAKKIYPLLEQMQANDLPLCIHGESIGKNDDIFEREKIFLNHELKNIIQNFKKLRIILEHISTKSAVDFVLNAPANVAATITPHHLYYNRNDLFNKGIHPHLYCLPLLKTADDQNALIEAAISGNPKFFLGTDSAPHSKETKESACGCAGIYSSHAALSFYAEIFEKFNAMGQLEKFASLHGAHFYQLPINTNTITLIKKPMKIAMSLSFGETTVIPMKAGEEVSWQIQ